MEIGIQQTLDSFVEDLNVIYDNLISNEVVFERENVSFGEIIMINQNGTPQSTFKQTFEEWKTNGINIGICGGSAYALHGGKERPGDLDFGLLYSNPPKDKKLYLTPFNLSPFHNLIEHNEQQLFQRGNHGIDQVNSFFGRKIINRNFESYTSQGNVHIWLATKKYLAKIWCKTHNKKPRNWSGNPYPEPLPELEWKGERKKWLQLLGRIPFKEFNFETYEEYHDSFFEKKEWKRIRRAYELAHMRQ